VGVLRICFCLSHYYPIESGAERQAHLQAKELVRRGHRVRVITRAMPGLPEVGELDGVTIHRAIRPRELGPLFGMTFVATLSSAIKRLHDEMDVLHCHQGLWEAVAAGMTAPRWGLPSVVQPAAGGEYGEIRQWSRTRGRGILRRYMLRNSHFVAISRQIQDELTEFGVPPERITRLGSGVDTAAYSPGQSSTALRLPASPRVLFLGRMHPQKNLLRLLDAWAEVRRRVAANLMLAGDGPQRGELEAAARRLGVADSVHFLGPVQNPIEVLRAADVFVLPSVAEGMSNSLLEAMSAGVPIIASSIGGNTDLLRDGVNGLMADPLDPAAWTRAIVQLLEEPATAARLGAAARESVVAEFSIEAIVDRYVELYSRLMGRNRE
jgi:glycosyltransferase involved in cell wall biosynthesis